MPLGIRIIETEKQVEGQPNKKIPEANAIPGATSKPSDDLTIRVRVVLCSNWNCRIEMNLSGDYNDKYKQFDEVTKKTDEYGSGQPSVVYKVEVETVEENSIVPKNCRDECFGYRKQKNYSTIKRDNYRI